MYIFVRDQEKLKLVCTRGKLALRSTYIFIAKETMEKLPQNISFTE